jgi:hypothetical protein
VNEKIAGFDNLLQNIDKIFIGGHDLQLWILELLGNTIPYCNPVSRGIRIFLKSGGESEDYLNNIETNDQTLSFDVGVVERIVSEFWKKAELKTKTFKMDSSYDERFLLGVYCPIIFDIDKPIGYLWVLSKNPDIREAVRVTEFISFIVSICFYSERLRHGIEFLARPIWRELSSSEKFADEIADACMEAISCDAIIIWETTGNLEHLRTVVTKGDASGYNLDMNVGSGVAGKCVMEGKAILINDLLDTKELNEKGIESVQHETVVQNNGWRSAYFIPFDVGTEIAGVMCLIHKKPKGFTEVERKIGIAFAQRISAGYVHMKRIEELEKIEQKMETAIPIISTGLSVLERIHDVIDYHIFAKNFLDDILKKKKIIKSEEIGADHAKILYRNARKANDFIERSHEILKDIREQTVKEKFRPNKYDLYAVINEAIELNKLNIEKNKIVIIKEVQEGLEAEFDKILMLRAFNNIVSNSIYFLKIQAREDEKKIVINAINDEENVLISIKDNGPGITKQNCDKVFQYFFTTKKLGEGSGLGLPIVKSIIRRHGGQITIDESSWPSGEKGGTNIIISLKKVLHNKKTPIHRYF